MMKTSTQGSYKSSTAFNKIIALVILLLSSFTIVQAQTVYAITASRDLVSFNASSPSTITSTVPLTGTLSNHNIEGLDFRPATGQLFAFSYNAATGEAQVYRVKIATGVMTPVGAPVMLATGMSSIGFDFNPMADRIRVTSATRQNYRLNPNDGTFVIADGTLTYAGTDVNSSATPNVRGVAYSNSVAGATTTAIYYYDFSLNILATSTAPNIGTMNTVGSSGIVTSASSGIDLDILTNASTNTGYLLAGTSANATNFYTINLATGATTMLGQIGNGLNIIEMAVSAGSIPVNKLVYGIAGSNLVSFYSSTPSTIIATVPLTGFGAGQSIIGIDFRPATGQLYAMGYIASSGATQIYTVNTATGAATMVGSPVTLAANMVGIGFDFNPTADRIRVTSTTDQNYRLNPNDGTLSATDTPLTYAPGDANASMSPTMYAVAYSNSYPGTPTTTTIYYYDAALNNLATSAAPNGGVVNTVGSTGIIANTAAEIDLDITSNAVASTNMGYLVASINGSTSNFYTLNLATGATMLVGTIAAGSTVSDIAVYIAPPTPVKNVYALQGNNLINFSTTSPGTTLMSAPITGVTAGQVLEGLDFRPLTGQLYGMGYRASTGETQLYVINTTTGAAVPVGSAVTLATGMTGIGFDFNPTVDRIRVTSSSRKNYRLNPIDGTISATDTDLTYAPTDTSRFTTPDIHAVAYTNSFSGTATTSIYYYDFNLDQFATSANPNGGVLNTVGRTGLNTSMPSGLDLDIVPSQANTVNTAFLSANTGMASSNFYQVNLSTGEASLIGAISGQPITKMAVSTIDVTLPITLTDFSVEKVGKASRLKWITQSEVNNDYFIIERSTDGTTFRTLSNKVSSKAINGSSSARLTYEYNDVLPVKGINYYRLLQVDKDGRSKYSKTLQVAFDDVSSVRVYPNPTRGIVNISANITAATTLSVRVVDGSGKNVLNLQYKATEGLSNNTIDLSKMATGMYYVSVADNTGIIFNQVVQKQ